MVESVQQKILELEIGIFGRIAAIMSDNNKAPHSSSRGRDTVLTGATRVLAVSKRVIMLWPTSTRKYIAAPYAFCDALQKTMMLYLHLWLETNPPWNTDLFKLEIAAEKFLPSLIFFCGDIFIPGQPAGSKSFAIWE